MRCDVMDETGGGGGTGAGPVSAIRYPLSVIRNRISRSVRLHCNESREKNRPLEVCGQCRLVPLLPRFAPPTTPSDTNLEATKKQGTREKGCLPPPNAIEDDPLPLAGSGLPRTGGCGGDPDDPDDRWQTHQRISKQKHGLRLRFE